MTSRDFMYWIQGFIELSDEKVPTEAQWKLIKAHAAMVFKHEIDPSMGGKSMQQALDDLHKSGSGGSPGGDVLIRC